MTLSILEFIYLGVVVLGASRTHERLEGLVLDMMAWEKSAEQLLGCIQRSYSGPVITKVQHYYEMRLSYQLLLSSSRVRAVSEDIRRWENTNDEKLTSEQTVPKQMMPTIHTFKQF